MKNFDLNDLRTYDSKDLQILSFGDHNSNSGPDFLNAQIKLNDIQWAGHIEIHVKSSDWILHKHSTDDNYKNVILHVVLDHDVEIKNESLSNIPVLELKNRIPQGLLNNYLVLKNTKSWIPCQKQINTVTEITISSMMSRVLAERMTEKSESILSELSALGGNWNEIIYQRLSWAFGLSVNAEAFKTLAKKTPFSILLKHSDNLFQLEAILFGQTGLLDRVNSSHEYISKLKNEYLHLSNKYSLIKMNPVEWSFMRMRPAGFPTIRIAQLARFINNNTKLDSLLFDVDSNTIIESLTIKIEEGYWFSHYTFDDEESPKKKTLGSSKRNVLFINVIVPIIYAYGRHTQSQEYLDKALQLLEKIGSEKNNVINNWEQLGVKCSNGSDSQALLQLKKHYCDQFKCLSCSIGHQVLKTKD